MGQTQGKAAVVKPILPFINLTEESIGATWQKFNIIADNWGLTEGQFVQICTAAATEMDKSPESVQPLARTLFGALDTDANGSVDALEFLATLSMVSGMEEEAKLRFVFNCYDFAEGKEVTVDEMTLAIKSTLTGLAKVAKFTLPSLGAMEVVSKNAFRSAGIDPETGKISHEDFVSYCSKSPDVSSWINFFVDADDTAQEKGGPPEDEELMEEGADPTRSARQEAENSAMIEDLEGGESTAERPWAQLVGQDGSAPTEPPASNPGIPDVNADLKWVHGYRAADTRNNLRYTGNGQICYHAAGVGIVYTAEGWKDPAGGEEAEANPKAAQRFNTTHSDDIIALAMHPSGQYVATGEMGAEPKIVIWDSNTMEAVQVIKGFHKLAVQHLEFSPSGKLLASVGQDADNSVAVYEWATKKKLYSSKVDKNKLLDCRWASENNFGVCGVKSMWFFKNQKKGGYQKQKGLFGQKGKIQAILSLAAIGDETQMVSGSAGGELYVWTGRNCTKSVKAHDKSVNSLYYSPAHKLLVSGGKDGHIKIWSRILKLQQDFCIHDCAVPPAIEGVKPASRPTVMDSVRSVCLSDDASKILVGTRGCEIFEISAATGTNTNMAPDQTADVGSVLVSGHYRDELWGLAIHPSKAEYATVGDDKFVRIWSMDDNKCIKKTELENMGRAIAYSPDGKSIAVGLGGILGGGRNKKNRLNGALKILSEDDLSISGDACDAKEPISDVKFSGDGKTLAMASLDGAVYLYNTADWTVKAKCEGAKGGVTHVDFSKDGAAIMVNTEGHELLYFVTDTGEANGTGNVDLKDAEWTSSTCPLSWAMQGIHAPMTTGTDYNAVHRSSSGKLVAAADDYGKVKLYNYPCLDSASGFTASRGHSSHVTSVRFNNDDTKMITTGGNDRCIFQWDLDIDGEEEDGEEPEVPDPNAEPEEAPVEEEDEEGAEKIPEEEPDSDPEEDFKVGAEVERDETLEKHNSDDMEDLFGLEEATTGDEFMAVKPWQGAIVAPSAAKTPKVNKSAPDDSLTLEWVHGYRAQDARSNLFYNEEGEICYSAAAVGITLNKKEWTQKHNLDHTDDIVSVAMSRCGKYCATGQMGKRPIIVVWNSSTGETISTIKCGRIRAVSQLAFSNNGKYLVAVGEDDDHTVTVYNWRDMVKISTSKGDKNKCFCVSWSPDDRSIVTCGVKFYRVYQMNGRNMKAKKGLFGKACKIQTLYSIGWLSSGGGEEPEVHTCVIGAKDGTLCKIEPNEDGTCGRKFGDVIEAGEDGHQGAVNSIYSVGMDVPKDGEEDSPFKGGIITGGKDGKVICWDATLNKIVDGDTEMNFNLQGKFDEGPNAGTYKMAPKCFKRIIRSVCINKDLTKVLVGTKGSEIYEFSARADFGRNINDGPLIQAHCKDELWGLAMHPTKAEYCTVGDDKTVRVWDLNTKKLIKMQKLDEMCRAVCYSPDGTLIAVGQGGSVGRGKRKKDGAFKVLNESDLSSLYEGHESHEWIQDVKFSPDGNTLAVGSHDNIIYMHSCADWSVKAKCEAHNSYITHFDFSADSQWLKSTCGAYELLYFDANTAAQEPAASKLKDVDWSTQTCTLGWPVQGIWPPCADGTDINGVDRSSNGKLIATADDFGKVKVFNYPVLDKDAGFLEHRGHSSHVTNVRFSLGDTHVVTTGGNDRCVFQWKRQSDEDVDDGADAGAKGEDEDLDFECCFGLEVAAPADQFGAVKPWIGAIQAPSEPPNEEKAAPQIGMELDWVHGYRAQDARSNLFYNAQGEICYSAAGVGIAYNKKSHTQSHYVGHDDDIVCLAMSPDGKFIATGQMGKRPHVHIWDASTCAQVKKLPRFHKRAITSVAFSADGKRICSVGQDDDHSVAVWKSVNGEWADGKRTASCKGSKQKVFFAHFTGAGDFDIVTGGQKHVLFYTIDGTSSSLNSKKGIFGKKGKIQSVLSAATVGGCVVTGTASGHLYKWKGRIVEDAVTAHAKSVNDMFTCANGQLVTGSKDGTVKIWSDSLESLHEFDITDAADACLRSSIRSVCCDANMTRVLVGTKGSEIYEIQIDKGSAADAFRIGSGHFKDELWGLASHPTDEDLYATCGDDATVRVWSVSQKRVVRQGSIDCGGRAIAWKPDGTQLAIGMGYSVGRGKHKEDGMWCVVDAETMEVVTKGQEAKEWISDIKYSPDGKQLAIGSHDNKIYLYDTTKGYAYKGIKCEAHNSYITHFDYTSDGKYLRSTCGAYELLFHSASNGAQDPSGASKLKNTEFSSETCTLGWGVQGIWPEAADGTDINAVCKSADGKLVATADDFGAVKVYQYPCVSQGNGSVEGKGHSSHVTNVRFQQGDGYMITTGGNDRSILQWKLSPA